MSRMSQAEHRKLIRLYLGVNSGYLGEFSDIVVLEKFYIRVGVDVDPRPLAGTNREKFEHVLQRSSASEQAAIIRGALKMHPPDDPRCEGRTQDLHDELLAVAARLEGCAPVAMRRPVVTCDVVEKAIDQAEDLIGKRGFSSAVDRVHTMLHGYLRNVCDDAGIEYGEKQLMSGLFALIRQQHPAFQAAGQREAEMVQIFRSMSSIMDALNPIRNESSMAHPNKELIDAPEAGLVIDLARSILHYVDMKVAAVNGSAISGQASR